MLKEILEHKREEVSKMTLPAVERKKPMLPVHVHLRERPVIAEVKRTSPSAGVINASCDPAQQAVIYSSSGAGAVSVLTDKKFFHDSLDDLRSVISAISIPVLCKDFIVDEIQIEAAYRCGADMILLIAAALSDMELRSLSQTAERYGMAILYEIHDMAEFERIRHLYPLIVGVNSRDLRDFSIDHERAANVIRELPHHILRVAESGISSAADIERMKKSGADAFLVGTALMKAADPGMLLSQMLEAAGGRPCS